jgi:ABC-type multidrug transport system fused ATPase/permease subunit
VTPPPGAAHAAQLSEKLSFRWVLNVFLRTWPFIRPSLKDFGIFLALSAVVALIGVFLVFIVFGFTTTGIVGGDPVGSIGVALWRLDPDVYVNVEALTDEARRGLIWPAIITTIVLLGITVPAGLGLSYYSIWIFQQVNQRMRLELIDRLQAQSLQFHANAKAGDAIYRVYQDSAMVTGLVRSILLEPLLFLGRYVVGLVVVAAFDPFLGLVLALAVPPILYLGYRFSAPLRRRFRVARENNSALTSRIQESVLGIRVIKACHAEGARSADFSSHSRAALDAAFRARVSLTVLGILAFAVIGLATLTVESVAALLANANAQTFGRWILLGYGFAVWNYGSFFMVNNRANEGLGSLRALMATWGKAQDMAMGLGRVFEILDLEPDVQDAADAQPLAGIEERVAFEGVTFGYDPARPVFEDVSFSATLGAVTAIVGPTGTGKSTLMALLLRLADPDSGRITIDGKDLRSVTVASIRRHIALATQENILFSASVLENIRFAKPDATPEAVAEAARVACADTFIEALAERYDTPLGERATKLSTGQRQRIVIARAVVKDAPILILDEPTAALDAVTEAQVLDSLKAWGERRCIFLITHRLSTIRRADQIIYLRDKKVLGVGTHDELIAGNDAYRAFVEAELGIDPGLGVAG